MKNPLENIMEKLMERDEVRACIQAGIPYDITTDWGKTGLPTKITFKTKCKVRFTRAFGYIIAVESKHQDEKSDTVEFTIT